ncbi:MAG: alpha/beta fold hydrolase [Burkholderiales bacterium]
MIQKPTSKFTQANGLQFHYLDWGSADSPPLVLLHGVGQTCHTWDLFAAAMAPHFHVMAFDQRGHGDSDWAADRDYSRGTMVSDVSAFTSAVGLEDFFLIGMSMGGMNSMMFTSQNIDRVRSLVVVDIGPRVERTGSSHIRDFMSNNREFDDLDEAAAVIHKFNPRRPLDSIRNFTCVYNLKQLPSGKWTWKYDSYFASAQRLGDPQVMHDQLAAAAKLISCPTLLVRGAQSPVLSHEGAKEFQRLIPSSAFELVEGAGHSVMGDNPAGFEAAVRGFYVKQGVLST